MRRNDNLEFTLSIGDTRTPLFVVLVQSGKPVDLGSLTPKFQMETRGGASVIAETATNVTGHPTTAFTADASSDELIANDHLVIEGDQIVVSNSGGALPAGLAASTRYFARDVKANRFKVGTAEGAAAVDITDAGTGTHSFYIVGSVQYAWQSADVDTTGAYKAWFTVFNGSDFDTFPQGKHIDVLIVER